MENLLVSFSGGETSAFMAQWLKKHYINLKYKNIVFVFANTGQENNETLDFTERCDKKFDLKLHWIEAAVSVEKGKGTFYSITDFEHATRINSWRFRNDTPFEMMIKKYGIPNQSHPHCTRELKQVPIQKFGNVYFGGEKYHTAIGIRSDEIDRVNEKREAFGLVYPLINMMPKPVSKPMVNLFWKNFEFRLDLKGYEGNCATCWKKSDKKIYKIIQEHPEKIEFMKKMERKYGKIGHEFESVPKNGLDYKHRVFFRKNRSAKDMIKGSKEFSGVIKNDSDIYDYQESLNFSESCEVFSNCGDL
jgi:hypothetical protein